MTFDDQLAKQSLPTQGVHAAIVKVMATLAKDGISKDRKNQQQGYNFRGIDDVYNALSAALVDAKLVIIPSFSDRRVVERESAKGGALFNVTVQGTFTLIAEDGSRLVAGPFFGEAMDSADKASNKSMSACFKYMAMEVFCIPTEGDNDADATTHSVKPRQRTESEPPSGSARGVAVEAFQALDPMERESIVRRAQDIMDTNAAKGIVEAVDALHAMKLDADQKLAIWSQFDSELRSSIKREEARRTQLREVA